jgi:hypothetical protein
MLQGEAWSYMEWIPCWDEVYATNYGSIDLRGQHKNIVRCYEQIGFTTLKQLRMVTREGKTCYNYDSHDKIGQNLRIIHNFWTYML